MNITLELLENPEKLLLLIMSSSIVSIIFCVVVMLYQMLHEYMARKKSIYNQRKQKAWLYHYNITILRVFSVISSNTGIILICFFIDKINSLVLYGLIIAYIIKTNKTYNQMYLVDIGTGPKRIIESSPIHGDKTAISNLRLMSSIEVLIMLIINSAFDKTNDYKPIVFSMLCLVLGRFIYFDTFDDSLMDTLKQMLEYKWYGILAAVLTIVYLWNGYSYGVLSTSSLLGDVFIYHMIWMGCIKLAKKLTEDIIIDVLYWPTEIIYNLIQYIKKKALHR